MARINLLPWRETRKKEREKRFYISMGLAAIVTFGVLFIVHSEMESRFDLQNKRNQFLATQIRMLEQQIKDINNLEVEKTRLLNRMEIIQQLQKSRPEIVHLFEELVLTVPEGAQILKLSQSGIDITIEGIAESNSRVSSFMRNLDKSKWLKDPELIVIEANKKEFPKSSWFSLKVKRSQPK
jgi:type IV pilus assembly protein PilN